MSDKTAIEWSDATWNPVTGCTKVSPGCAHCYAETFAERFRGVAGHPFERGFDVQLRPEKLDLPLRWKKPRRIFVNSMSDLFHEDVPDEYIAEVFSVMARCQHTFQVLTKRPERMQRFCTREAHWWGNKAGIASREDYGKPLPNVWLGVSVENQRWADERIPLLLQTPAAVRFLSLEPLLGAMDLRGVRDPDPSWEINALLGLRESPFGAVVSREQIARIDWVIIGGESGPGARPMELAWARSLVAQCKAAGVPVFVKQLGSVWAQQHNRKADRAGRDFEAWPGDLRVREFPAKGE